MDSMSTIEMLYVLRKMLIQGGITVCDLTYPPKDQLVDSDDSKNGSYNSYITATALVISDPGSDVVAQFKADVAAGKRSATYVVSGNAVRYYLFCRNKKTPPGSAPMFSSFEFGTYETRSSFNSLFKYHRIEFEDDFQMLDTVATKILETVRENE